ncbi:MAG: hypothetical protein M1818_006506 [Claussenomyces sp. TS43310]|nr:MAG: hypothetical protein M1818_006506 [Claussenomyces sp. TS43310]
MSSFSRGLILRQCRLHHYPSCRAATPNNPRNFSLSTLLFRGGASKPTRRGKDTLLSKNTPPVARRPPPPPPPAAVQTPPSATTATPQYQSYAAQLAARAQPTLLYRAPSHTLFIISSYTGATFCFAYAAYNLQAHCLHPPPGLPVWVPPAFGGVCFLMACFGGWLALGPARLVRTITARPPSFSASGTGSSITASFSTSQPGGPLRLDVELRKMFPIPFFPARVITAAPEEMQLQERLWTPPPPQLTAAERAILRRDEEARRAQQLAIERSRILTAPFRHANLAFHKLFQAIARTWSRTGFLKLNVKGQTYKLDISGGWGLDDGRALDRLVKAKHML